MTQSAKCEIFCWSYPCFHSEQLDRVHRRQTSTLAGVFCISSVLKSIRVESPLTSVDFTLDGTGLVVGSTQGKIYQYDLRNSSTPTRIAVAHKTSVNCLRFQSNVKQKVPWDVTWWWSISISPSIYKDQGGCEHEHESPVFCVDRPVNWAVLRRPARRDLQPECWTSQILPQKRVLHLRDSSPTQVGSSFYTLTSVSFLWTRTRCHLYKSRLVCDSLKQKDVATVLSPAGGVGVDGISREAEGQQGTEPTVEKFNRIRPHSLDVFSPARDSQMMLPLPSHVFHKHNLIAFNFKFRACLTVFVVFFRLEGSGGSWRYICKVTR